ncbi:MAG: DUF1343 domain-containing protein [Acidobacteriia bacterium]|nr:DUF1343 domain-containing protein [Terriglobia bacterium]
MRTVLFAIAFASILLSGSPGDLDEAVEESIRLKEIPGAVLWVGKLGAGGKPEVLHSKAYGNRALVPAVEPMTMDTMFDAASLTKVVATTSCVMKLFEQGKIRLNDPVTRYLPEFQGGKSEITVRHLLTHYSGLRPDVDLKPAWSGYETGIQLALIDKPVAGPGETFLYSDINYLLLGEMVRRLSGKSLAEYARETVFDPLGMQDTMFQPPEGLLGRIAPTERLNGSGAPLRGVVHDPTTRYMGGIAGHAGLFTTAADLAKFAGMLLGEGASSGDRIFSAAVVRKFTTPQSPADRMMIRGLGWDMDTRFTANRGELFPLGGFGHTGFTGTSMWMDPVSRTYVILLTNSVHPRVIGPISSLRSKVATIVAAQAGYEQPGAYLSGYNETMAGARRRVARNGEVLTGLDVLVKEKFARLSGKRVGLITNHTGFSRDGKRNVDLMLESGVRLTALFSPEHGIAGVEDHENVGHARDAAGIPVYSLYEGKNRRPSKDMLRNVDVLVFDIQDMGTRFYTYMCTMLYAMEEAARHNISFLVLDRPNPLNGVQVEGPMLDTDLESFVGCYPLPLRHGMSLGEIAKMAQGERGWSTPVDVVKMEGWQRGDWWDSTGLVWVNPSPNMRSLQAALLYPGVAMLEYWRDYSVGRGTDAPFEQIGADWMDGRRLAAYLNSRKIAGVRFHATRFQPTASNFAGKTVEGVRLLITDRDQFSSSQLGLELAAGLLRLFPGRSKLEVNQKLIGNWAVMAALEQGEDPRVILERERARLEAFLGIRTKYLLY